ncbi:hypothetical protein [Evansella tamaricis]|uniref:Uncharacterized protein n=1 Tax=Evansella tamaricis TaxID=2069301 RepID=A0ABS6JDD3_9BACI|nr:hypothetical protein [Evansella tamaricis]MBU9711692.1 hypothetical protein [Evansella tamaricis]
MSKAQRRFWSIFISFILVLMIFLGISEMYVTIHKWIKPSHDVTALRVGLVLGLIITILVSTHSLAKIIRTNPNAVSIGTTNIPNFMYHSDFVEERNLADSKLINKNRDLKGKISKQEEYIDELINELEVKDIELGEVAYISDIFIRHHKNASRLVRSLIQMKIGSGSFVTMFWMSV